MCVVSCDQTKTCVYVDPSIVCVCVCALGRGGVVDTVLIWYTIHVTKPFFDVHVHCIVLNYCFVIYLLSGYSVSQYSAIYSHCGVTGKQGQVSTQSLASGSMLQSCVQTVRQL